MLGKQLIYLGEAKAAGIVMGSKVPIVLTSRSDDELDRLYSIALGAYVAQKRKQA
jgi:phosphotransacetylase